MKKMNNIKMKKTVNTIKKIKVSNKDHWVEFTIDENWNCIGFNSSLPYKKKLKDWEFLSKAIKIMIEEVIF